MNLKKLTTSEVLMKEMSEIRANQLAKQLIDDQKDVDASNNISYVIAVVLPLVKPAELQQKVYQLLTEASASFTATQAKLSATVRRVQELTQCGEGVEEPSESQVSIQEISEEAQQYMQDAQPVEEAEEVEHEPS